MHEIAIIGSGPAGYTAGIYAGRANLEPVLFEGLESGGQLMLTTDVENYPGFQDGIMGPELMQVFKKQAQRFGTEIKTEYRCQVAMQWAYNLGLEPQSARRRGCWSDIPYQCSAQTSLKDGFHFSFNSGADNSKLTSGDFVMICEIST